MSIYISSDHAGYELKNKLVDFLKKQEYEVTDCGPFHYTEDDDYPDFVATVARQVSENPTDCVGIVIGGSGQGEAIMANRFLNVRAVVFNGQYKPADGREVPDELLLTREHNNANVLSLGAWFLSEQEVQDAAKHWLATPFKEEERHLRRLRKIEALSPMNRSSAPVDPDLQ